MTHLIFPMNRFQQAAMLIKFLSLQKLFRQTWCFSHVYYYLCKWKLIKSDTMTQIELNIKNKSFLPGAKRKGTLLRAADEVRKGKVTRVGSVAELMTKLDE